MAKVGSFGSVVFQVGGGQALTFRDWQETAQGRYAVQSMVNGGQAVQFLGADLPKRRLKIDLIRGLVEDPEAMLETLGTMLKSGQAYPVVLGVKIHGLFMLERLTVQRRRTDQHGRLIMATVDLELLGNGEAVGYPYVHATRPPPRGADLSGLDED